MNPTRRDFIRYVGILLAGALARSCGADSSTPTPAPTPTPVPADPFQVTCYVPAAPTLTPSPPPTSQVTCYTAVPLTPTGAPLSDNPLWAKLREYWVALVSLQQPPSGWTPDDPNSPRQLVEPHREALDALVQVGEVEAAVAEQIQTAFEEAADHAYMSTMMCYDMSVEGARQQETRADFALQLSLLDEMAAKSNVDPAIVAQAREALERDITWLDELRTGKLPQPLEEIEADPKAIEAARILVELLLDA